MLQKPTNEQVESALRNEVFYHVRNWEVADDEETRILDSDCIDDLPATVRQMCRTAMDDMESCRLAIQIYCSYWLRSATSEQIELAYRSFLNDWLDSNFMDADSVAIETRNSKCWLKIAHDWSYFR